MSRVFPDGTGGSQTTGSDLMALYAAGFKRLFDAAQLPLTGVDGTANDVTATVAPAFDGDGLVDGMCFGITWGAANTGGMTLAINGGTALPILDAAGVALTSGAVASGVRSTLGYIGGEFRILSPLGSAAGGGATFDYQEFLSSSTWTKPAGLDDDALVIVELWGGGGGGDSNTRAGGGGGAYARAMFRAADLPSSVAVNIGAGGTIGNAGGNSTFGALLTAFGGGRGGNTAGSGGGGGGGSSEAGQNAANAELSFAAGGRHGGGDGAHFISVGEDYERVPPSMASLYGGGGGGAEWAGVGNPGNINAGWSTFGGSGGGASGSGSRGISAYGGNGGYDQVNGEVPGGGGGTRAQGGAGKCIVRVIG